jgi:hypothetical protein
MTWVCFNSAWCYQYLKTYEYVGTDGTDVITNFIFFLILSCLSCFLDFSANSFLRFHFVFQKAVLCPELWAIIILFMQLQAVEIIY